MATGRQSGVNRGIDWVDDEDYTVLGFQRPNRDFVGIARVETPEHAEKIGATIVLSSAAPDNADGRPDGTIYIQTA